MNEQHFHEQLRLLVARWADTTAVTILDDEKLEDLWKRNQSALPTDHALGVLAGLVSATFLPIDITDATEAIGKGTETFKNFSSNLRGQVIPPKKPGTPQKPGSRGR